MKHSIRLAAMAALVLLSAPILCAGEANYPGLEGIPEIVAEVGGKPITRVELIRELVGASGSKSIERLVHRILVEQAAAEQKIRVTEQDIDYQYELDRKDLMKDRIRIERNANAPIPMEEAVRMKFGMSIAEYKNTIIRQRILMRRCLESDITPNNEELRKFYDAYPDLFQEQVRYRAAHILITPRDMRDIVARGGRTKNTFDQMDDFEKMRKLRIDRWRDDGIKLIGTPEGEVDDMWRDSKIQADRYAQELQAFPQRWNDYVKRYTRDPLDHIAPRLATDRRPPATPREDAMMSPGEVGWYNKHGPMVNEFFEGTKNLKVGQISSPIRTEFGWHIVKMLDIKFPKLVTFAECKEKVRRLYIENEIQLLSESWLVQLSAAADLKTEKATLWPPKVVAARPMIGIDMAGENEAQELDPVVGRVNGTPIKRSEVWRDLLRSEGEEALTRLINREVVLTLLKTRGVAYMEWLCANPKYRSQTAPPSQPIMIKEEAMQRELNDDRLEYDKLVSENAKEYGSLKFEDFIFRKYGQFEAEYRRAIEASLVLRAAIRMKVVPRDPEEFERTLAFEFAMAREQYSQTAWFEISHILIVPSGGMLRAKPDAMLAARMAADNIYRQCLAKPESWAQLVEQFSDDTPENKARHGKLSGCYIDFTPSDVPESEQFYNEIRQTNIEAGMLTPPIRSARGFHIVRLDKKHPAVAAELYTSIVRDKDSADLRQREKGSDGFPKFDRTKDRMVDSTLRKKIERDYINEQAKFYADVWLRALNSRAIVKHYLYKSTRVYEEGSIPDVFPTPKD